MKPFVYRSELHTYASMVNKKHPPSFRTFPSEADGDRQLVVLTGARMRP